jgi:hypothetical protein
MKSLRLRWGAAAATLAAAADTTVSFTNCRLLNWLLWLSFDFQYIHFSGILAAPIPASNTGLFTSANLGSQMVHISHR